jgi:hypothetical protein
VQDTRRIEEFGDAGIIAAEGNHRTVPARSTCGTPESWGRSMATIRQRHEVPAAERAQVLREFQHVLQQAGVALPDSLTATVAPDDLRRTDNVINTGFIPGGGEDRRK